MHVIKNTVFIQKQAWNDNFHFFSVSLLEGMQRFYFIQKCMTSDANWENQANFF